jgi:hypothetical protein
MPSNGGVKTVPIQRITPFLWFDPQAEEAARFYTSIFPNKNIPDPCFSFFSRGF